MHRWLRVLAGILMALIVTVRRVPTSLGLQYGRNKLKGQVQMNTVVVLGWAQAN